VFGCDRGDQGVEVGRVGDVLLAVVQGAADGGVDAGLG
jgi:hypothetical protein